MRFRPPREQTQAPPELLHDLLHGAGRRVQDGQAQHDYDGERHRFSSSSIYEIRVMHHITSMLAVR